MAKVYSKACAALIVVGVVLTGCSTENTADVAHLTIVTTAAPVEQATAMAVSEYVQDQGTAVDIQYEDDTDAVFAALDDEPTAEQAVIGMVVGAQADTQDDATELRLPNDVDIVSQAPAELALTPVASTITAAQFSQAQSDDTASAASAPLETACAPLTWVHGATRPDDVEPINQELAAQGCEPTFENPGLLDTEAYEDLTDRLITETDTVAMLYNLDPVIDDLGLTSLELETDSWPRSSAVAVTQHNVDETLAEQVSSVLENFEGQAATDLLRGYHDAHTSASALQYDIDDAVRYWLVEQELLDDDTVTDMSTDNE